MDQQGIFNSLELQGPDAWLAYLHPFEDGAPITGLSMLVIFHYAAPEAKKHESLDWAEVAIRAAELETRTHSGTERESALFDAMNLRSWFISRKGSIPGHFVLDKAIILDWVMDGLKLPIQAARETAAAFWGNVERAKNSPNPDDLRQVTKEAHLLSGMKRRLNVVKALADCGELPSDSVLYDWLRLRESLP